jgi:hypothetical protein
MEAHKTMKFLLTLLMIALLSVPVWAQQDPNDLGAQDSIILRLGDRPNVTAGDSTFTLNCYFFNDENRVINSGGGFHWDHDGIVLDSAVITPTAQAGFTQFFLYYKNNLDSANLYHNFQFSAFRFDTNGLAPSPTPQLMCVYHFHVDSLLPTDSIRFDSSQFSGGTVFTFTNTSSVFYSVAWSGTFYALDRSDVNTVETGQLPTEFRLDQNYPNPFNPTTTIQFDVPKASHVTLSVYNVLGQRVTTLIDEKLPAERKHTVTWYGTNDGGSQVASGIYFYRLQADGNVVDTKKMLLLK